ncbi:hypothetical protein HHS_05400 [Candidatus Pantoea carbekii]|uniref:Colicin V production protein n=1 Tax=Candidatus Pantoea carbekii TaxID=1235990 RepID=U3U6D1_9GAMM|nr:hypothetical protein HHS_05400 [Candidatus Pantoea carbekii]
MTWIDYVIILVISLSIFINLIRGFMRGMLSLVICASAFFFASHYYSSCAIWFSYFRNEVIRNSIAIAFLFFSTLMIGSIINYLMIFFIEKTGLSEVDKILGGVFGALCGILFVSFALFLLEKFTSFPKNQDWRHSQLIPQFSYIIRWILNYLYTWHVYPESTFGEIATNKGIIKYIIHYCI